MTSDLLSVHIFTPRLLLRPVIPAYKSELHQEFDADITRYMYALPHRELEDAEEFIRLARMEAALGNSLQLLILEKNNSQFVGCVNFNDLPSPNPELGIWIKKEAQGKGYAKEAVKAMLNWADYNLDYDYIVYPVDERNKSSRRIPESFKGRVQRQYNLYKITGHLLKVVEYHIPRGTIG